MRSAIIPAAAYLALTMASGALAEDVNRTGQPQVNDAGKAGTPAQGGDANTMGGATTERTLPSEHPAQLPQTGNQSGDKTKNNSKPNEPTPGNR